MLDKSTEAVTQEKICLEMQQIINRRLHERNVIDRATYETVKKELLKAIQANT